MYSTDAPSLVHFATASTVHSHNIDHCVTRELLLFACALPRSLPAIAVSSAGTVAVLTAAASACCCGSWLLDILNMQPAIIRFAQQSFCKALLQLRLFTINASLFAAK
jgi:hypothetical protein